MKVFSLCLSLVGWAWSAPWVYHETPEHAGFSSVRLDAAEAQFRSMKSAAVMVVVQGKVLCDWGNTTTPYLTHSARKSFMSALYGPFVEQGMIDLHATMAELGIDDQPPLTAQEKTAQVIHLLKARSGVYHTAAAETDGMHAYKPDRGTYLPDQFWCYNNWDFNTLCTIFNQETGSDFFEELDRCIAQPLGMEDFNVAEDGFYYYQRERSIHPAYHFQMTARDAARFGQLFLQCGRWGDTQVLSEDWVEQCTTTYSDSSDYIPGTGYGMMWWTFPRGEGFNAGRENLRRFFGYAALGAGGQIILVIPNADMVFVHRVDTYQGLSVPMDASFDLADAILGAFESPQSLPERIMPHLAQTAGGFMSTIILRNPSDVSQSYLLQPYAADGTPLPEAMGSLESHTMRYTSPAELFGSEVSHFTVSGQIQTSVAYQSLVAEDSSPVVVHDTLLDVEAADAVFFPGNWDVVWDGLALVNPHDVTLMVTIQQEDSSGQILDSVTAEVQPWAKSLLLLSDEFDPHPQSHFRVNSEMPFILMAIQGEHGSATMWENIPVWE